ncbi:integration host factor subunit beta [Bordetella genomosp. 9]|uniref:Integration host factor subunit beta n=1 Tax=Bordetella genomosp. 9 TaxID=1416803 RepID=A0A1W6YZE6_9BORD|nr:integration host factor subunit beta [Bordetella genomosp. 9]ARP85963.1 integration host factor subunit beta [Bordetella genomosp. 9]ARP89984.1 integration host factor subunit beta [Bordetella genomosp. 9]
MTKSELIAALAARYPQLAARDTDYAVKTVLDAMAQALAAGQRIEIRGFGSFSLSRRSPRIGRNPKSGEQVLVPGKQVPHFKAGKELRERVDLDGNNNEGAPSSKSSSSDTSSDTVEAAVSGVRAHAML